MKIEEIRRANLSKLVEDSATIAALANAAEISESYISTILSGARNAGSRIARKLERATGRPEGWMDIDHTNRRVIEYTPPRLTPDETELLFRYRAAAKEKKALILALARL